jgi:multidrug resistance efflux pump
MNELKNNGPNLGPEGNRVSLSERVKSLQLPDRSKHGGASSALVWFTLVLCLLLGGVTGVVAWDGYQVRQTLGAFSEGPGKDLLEKLAKGDLTAPGADARLAPAAPGRAPAEGEVVLESKGYIIPVHQIQVSPKVSGMVMELNIEEGMQVKEGDVLAKLETVEYQSDRDRMVGAVLAAKHRWQELWKYREDEIRQAKAELDDSVAQRDQLFQEWKRNYSLKNVNVVAAKEYEQAESSYKSMDARVVRLQLALALLKKGPRDERIASAKGEIEQADADLAKAKWRLDNCTVRAPVSGTILTKKAEKGNIVNPQAFSNGLSASLCDMADLSDMEVDLAIAERDVARVFKGQICIVKAEAFPERAYKGVVSRLMPTADRSKGAVPVRVKIDIPHEEEGRYLRPEMGAVVTFYNKK